MIDTYCLRFALAFRCSTTTQAGCRLDLADLGPQEMLDLLHHLETERHSVATTRKVPLAAIHASFRIVLWRIRSSWNCSTALCDPFQRGFRPVEYLEFNEIQAVLAGIDRTTADVQRN